MVSIPDWSKFARLQDNYEKTTTSVLHRYHKQQENEIIRRAEEQGYFINPSEEYLLEECRSANASRGRKAKYVGDLRLIKLAGVHLREVGAITVCKNLQICILSNNFLTKIDGLATCRQLIKLDLHGNQLSSVPGVAFWSGMRKLKIVHLHDNPLGKYEVLQNLSTCSSLMVLTLYDTPLSLKRNYRHHVVNSIWSLKALDMHVISDEEIIEDAVFGGKFRALHQAFRLDASPMMPEDATYEEELSLVRAMEALINHILAHHSPVLIVQRCIRGYLVRKIMSMTGFTRKRKTPTTLPTIAPEVVPPPPSSSPAFSSMGQIGLDMTYQEVMGMDYDSYIKTHGPGSTTQSDGHAHPDSVREPHPSPQELDHPTSSRSSSPRKKLFINLAKLQSGTFQSLYEDSIAVETIIPSESLEKVESGKKKAKRKKKEKETQKKIVKSVKQFFGPVIESTPTSQEESSKIDENEEEMPLTNYRLKGYKPNINLIDPTTELLLTKQEAGRVVRDAEADHHRKVQELPRPKLPTRKSMNTDQRLFSRVHGTMGMSCLFAVHQAYRDREKAEKTAAKMEHIITMREERDRAKERIRLYHDEKRNYALKQRDYERARMLDSLEKRELNRLSYLDKRQDFRNKSSDLSRSYKVDQTFLTDFSNQHTSVSNALMRHDRQSQYDDQFQSKSDFVTTKKSSEQEQQETVKKYLEHRQLMRQTESAMTRASLDTKMLSEANDRIMAAKSRVAQQKARTETVQTFYPLPQTTPAPIPQTSCSAPPFIDFGPQWDNNGPILAQGRVGKHPTLVK